MRGTPETTIQEEAKDVAQDLLNAAAETAEQLLQHDADKVKGLVSSARVIGPKGDIVFHVVTTWWSRFIIIGYALLLGVCVFLAILTYMTQNKIVNLERQLNQRQWDKETQKTK